MRFYSIVLILVLCGCKNWQVGAPRYYGLKKNDPSLPKGTPVTIFYPNEKVPENSKLIKDISIDGDRTVKTYADYKKFLKNHAFVRGANIVQIVDIKNKPWDKGNNYKCYVILYKNMESSAIGFMDSLRKTRISNSTIPKDSNYALIHFYRPTSYLGSLIPVIVRDDQKNYITKLNINSRYTFKTKNYGKHFFTAKTEATMEVELDVQPGKEYFVRYSINVGAFVGRPFAEVIENTFGRIEYETMKFTNTE